MNDMCQKLKHDLSKAVARMTNYRLWLRVVFFGATVVLSGNAVAITDAEVDVLLQGIARDINSKLPSGSYQALVVAVVALPGKRFTYRTISGTSARQWSSEMRAHSRRIAVNDYCTNPSLDAYKELGVIVSWQLSDQDGNHITTNTVSPKDCRR